MSGSSTETKSKPASKRKLQKQRDEGGIAQAADAAGLTAIAISVGALWGGFGFALVLILSIFDATFQAIGQPIDFVLNHTARHVLVEAVKMVAPIAGLAVATSVLVTMVYNGGFVFAIKPVVPNFERISPQSGFKRIYGVRGWIETASALVRVLIWFAGLALAAWFLRRDIVNIDLCGLACARDVPRDLLLTLSIILVVLLLISAGIDMLLQKILFLREQKMTDSEVKKEQKEQLGSPEIRKERRKRMRDAAKSADAVGVNRANMCFFWGPQAIAVRYHPKHAPLPRITAVARSAAAVLQMRERVGANGFPELEDAEIVEGCRAAGPGEPVPEAMYQRLADGMSLIFRGQAPT